MTQRIRLVAIGAALAAFVAACGGGGVAADPEEDGSVETTATTEAAEGGDDSLASFFGWAEGDAEAQQMEFRDQEARIQEAIRVCMAEEGFDYVPVAQPDEAFTVWEEEDEEERVRTQGFGITTWYGEMGQEQQTTATTMAAWSDPNQERVDAMSETEQQAWYDALYGTQEEQEEDMTTEIDEETGETIYYSTGHGAGCQGAAYEAEYGEMEETQELWEELNPAFEAMYAQVEADPRIVEANQGWSACMASEGYEFESRSTMFEAVYADFEARVNEILGPNGGFSDPFEGWSEEEINAFFEEKTQEEIDAFFAEAEQASQANIDEEALSALQQEEIDMAVADFECSEGWNDLYAEVSEEYERDFIAANREILEQIRAAQGG